MRRRDWGDPEDVLATVRQPGVADAMAEGLMVHDDDCQWGASARALLDQLGISEETFFQRWAAGEYGG